MARMSDELGVAQLLEMVRDPSGPVAVKWCGRPDGLSAREFSAAKWALQVAEGSDRAREQALDREEGSVAQVMRHELSQAPTRSPAELAAAMAQDQALPGPVREALTGPADVASEVPGPAAARLAELPEPAEPAQPEAPAGAGPAMPGSIGPL
jgi:hypothetical protein